MASTTEPQKTNVLFVCLGNICRSTMAEAVFANIVQNPPHPLIGLVDSAGTGAYHIGSSPDPRTLAALESNHIDSYVHAARQVRESDFDEFQYIFGMDRENVSNLEFMKRRLVQRRGGDESGMAKVQLFGEYGSRKKKAEEVVDPYYGGKEGFLVAFEQMGRFSRAFLEELEKESEGKL